MSLADLQTAWRARWPEALEIWSRYTRLQEPRWCLTLDDEKAEQLTGSFAMIRFDDHIIVVSLRQVEALGLEDFALEVMAHEIGHHVLTPGDLNDHARMIARMRPGLPGREGDAPLVANLYTDLIINDRLQRTSRLRLADVYIRLGGDKASRLWTFYMRIYEILWSLKTGTLAGGQSDERLEFDAGLGARLVRVYAKDWMAGSGRFAALCLPYLPDQAPGKAVKVFEPLLDTKDAGRGGLPTGLTEIDADEEGGARHPMNDDDLMGLGHVDDDGEMSASTGRNARGSRKPRERVYRSPIDYQDILKSTGATLSKEEAVIRYYREAAMPYLVPFPQHESQQSTDPIPEGLDVWDAGAPLEEVDWLESVVTSPVVIPGVTTMKRVFGTTEGHSPEKVPFDLFIGVDCSGSMVNPAEATSFPVIGGAIMALSALRAGARVMVTLSGEPGSFTSTKAFLTDEHEVLAVLTGYLGVGYTFGIVRLRDAFTDRTPTDRPALIVIVTDYDIFTMLDGKDEHVSGWEMAAEALQKARGGGTYLLHMAASEKDQNVRRMVSEGWDTYFLTDWRHVTAFAQAFSHRHYAR